MPELRTNFIDVVSDYSAGDPMKETAVWTHLALADIAQELGDLGTAVGPDTVKTLLDEYGFVRRKARKELAMGDSLQRNEQFENIARLKDEYFDSPNPIISMDTKKKEFLGNFFRDGRLYTTEPILTLDHDFHGKNAPRIIPHGLFDVKRNVGHLTLGISHDTSQFACDSFREWWRRHGQHAYADATNILLLCDGGGSNNWRHYIFKEDLQRLVNRIGVSIRVAHYPPYCSKYNPIEHRLFPHVTRAWQGLILHTLDLAARFARQTWTSTGLRLTVSVIQKAYALKRKATDAFLASQPIVFEPLLPDWNYTVVPTEY